VEFDLTEDQHEIKDVAKALLAARSPFANVRHAAEAKSYQEELSSELLSLGWPGIAVAEEYGGQGLGAIELAVLLEELGYACAATPLLSTATAASVIQREGSSQQRARWLPGLARGEITAGVGSHEIAADPNDAAVIVLVNGDNAVLVDRAEADVSPMITIDGTRRFGSVRADGERLGVGAAGRLGAAIAAEIVGVCQRALDMTLAYVKEREQFGVAVGSFQAVSHRCAQMLFATESARSTSYYAAWAADAAPERLHEAAALAAAAAADAGLEVTASAIQAHGGIGFTWEADLHFLYKRAQLDAQLLGGASRHRAALARIFSEHVDVAVAN
jgi:alkylation response protein AidB-like acyl-CoA dehydrogenase